MITKLSTLLIAFAVSPIEQQSIIHGIWLGQPYQEAQSILGGKERLWFDDPRSYISSTPEAFIISCDNKVVKMSQKLSDEARIFPMLVHLQTKRFGEGEYSSSFTEFGEDGLGALDFKWKVSDEITYTVNVIYKLSGFMSVSEQVEATDNCSLDRHALY